MDSNIKKVNVKDYWEERLSNSFGLHGVGYNGLDVRFNKILYKVRSYVFKRLIKKLSIEMNDKSVLDIGAGTGFYIDLWIKNNAKNVSGIDLTAIAVENLRRQFSNCTFYQKDISEKNFSLNNDLKYDVVSIFDVLFHIVEDDKYKVALENLNSLLSDEGVLIISDFFISGENSIERPHIVFRTKNKIENLLNVAGFEVVYTTPMFYLLNNPAGSNNWFIKRLFPNLIRIARKSPRIGYLILLLIYPIELLLVSITKLGPTTDIYVCKKRISEYIAP